MRSHTYMDMIDTFMIDADCSAEPNIPRRSFFPMRPMRLIHEGGERLFHAAGDMASSIFCFSRSLPFATSVTWVTCWVTLISWHGLFASTSLTWSSWLSWLVPNSESRWMFSENVAVGSFGRMIRLMRRVRGLEPSPSLLLRMVPAPFSIRMRINGRREGRHDAITPHATSKQLQIWVGTVVPGDHQHAEPLSWRPDTIESRGEKLTYNWYLSHRSD